MKYQFVYLNVVTVYIYILYVCVNVYDILSEIQQAQLRLGFPRIMCHPLASGESASRRLQSPLGAHLPPGKLT
jgi:hypothetical protein